MTEDKPKSLEQRKAEMPPGSNTFTIPEQEGFDKAQAERASSYLHLTQLLHKVLTILDSLTIHKVAADKACEEDLSIFAMVRDGEKRWLEIFIEAAKHHDSVIEILERDKKLVELRIGFINSMRNLPDDSILLKRAKDITDVLDGLEKHRASGLIEALSKL